MSKIKLTNRVSNILRNTVGAVAVWAAVFIASIGVVTSIYMLGGQSNVQSNESNYQAMLGNATRFVAKDFVRWQIDRSQNVPAPKSSECIASDSRSCSALNKLTAPYIGGKDDLDDTPALVASRDIIKDLILASNTNLVYHEGRTDATGGAQSRSTSSSAAIIGANHFCVTQPRVFERNGKKILGVALGFPREADREGNAKYCDCSAAYQEGENGEVKGIPGSGCQTVTSERLIGYTDIANAPENKPLNLMFVLDASGQARESGVGDKIGGAMDEVQSVLEGMFAVNFDKSFVGSNLYAQQLVCTDGLCGCAVDGGKHGDAVCSDGKCGGTPADRTTPTRSREGGSFRGGSYDSLGFSGCIYSEHSAVRPETPINRSRSGERDCGGSEGQGCGTGDRNPDRHRTYPFEVAYYASPDLACANRPDEEGRLHLHNNEIDYTTWTYRISKVDDEDAYCNTRNYPRSGCAGTKKTVIYTCTGEGNETPLNPGTGTGGGNTGGGTDPEDCPETTGCGDIGGFFDNRANSGASGRSASSRTSTGGSNGLKGQQCTKKVCETVDNYCDGYGLGEGLENFCGCDADIKTINANPALRAACLNKQQYERVDWLRSCPHQAVVETSRALHDCTYRFKIQNYYTELGGRVDEEVCASAGCIVKSRLVKDPLVKMRIRNTVTKEVIEGDLQKGAITDVASYQDSDDNTLKNWKYSFPVDKWNWECSEPKGYDHEMTEEQGKNNFTRENKNCVPTGDVDLKAKEYKRVFVPEGCDMKTGENCDIPLGDYEMYVYVDKHKSKTTPEIDNCLVDTDEGKLPSYRHGFNKSGNCNVVDAYDDSGVCPNGVCDLYEDSNKLCTGKRMPGVGRPIAQIARSGGFDDINAGPHLGSIGIEGLRLTPTQTIQNVQCDLNVEGKGRSVVQQAPFAGKSILSALQPNEEGVNGRRVPELFPETKGKPDILACKFKLHDLSCVTDPGRLDKHVKGYSNKMPANTTQRISECGIKEGGWGCVQSMLSRVYKPTVKGGYRIFEKGHEPLAACQGVSCTVNAAMQHMNDQEAKGAKPSRPIVIPVMSCPSHKCSSETGDSVANSEFKEASNTRNFKGFETRWSSYSNDRGAVEVTGDRHRLGTPACSNTSGSAYGKDSATTDCLISESQRVRDNDGIIFPLTFCPDNAYGKKLAIDMAGGHDASKGFVDSFGSIGLSGAGQDGDFALAMANLIYILLLEARPELGVEMTQGADATYDPDA